MPHAVVHRLASQGTFYLPSLVNSLRKSGLTFVKRKVCR